MTPDPAFIRWLVVKSMLMNFTLWETIPVSKSVTQIINLFSKPALARTVPRPARLPAGSRQSDRAGRGMRQVLRYCAIVYIYLQG